MQTVKLLKRIHPVNFSVKPMVKKQLTPTQDRASFIVMLCSQGASYQEAVRQFDKQQKGTKNA